jgi:hypothetical protein
MASDENAENEILTSMRNVLSPLGPERTEEILGWATTHLEDCPLLAYCCAQGETGDRDAFEFRIGSPSPLDTENTVFAIFHWFAQGTAVVYSFKAALLEDGRALGVYTRDVVFRPRFLSGPVTLEAMFADLDYHLHATPWDDVEDLGAPPSDEPAPPNAHAARDKPAPMIKRATS